MLSNKYHPFHLAHSETRPNVNITVPSYFTWHYTAQYLDILILAGLWHIPFSLNRIIVLLGVLMPKRFVVGEEIRLHCLTNESFQTQDNPQPHPHPKSSCSIFPQLTIFIFSIYHLSSVCPWIPDKSIKQETP